MPALPKTFFADTSGAVTVDWVVLTAALVGLGLATMGVVSSGVESTASKIDARMSVGGIIKTSFGAYKEMDWIVHPNGYIRSDLSDDKIKDYYDSIFEDFGEEIAMGIERDQALRAGTLFYDENTKTVYAADDWHAEKGVPLDNATPVTDADTFYMERKYLEIKVSLEKEAMDRGFVLNP